jgi:integrase-like protein
VLPASRVLDGLNITPDLLREPADIQAPTDHIPVNGQVERMNRTIKDATVKRYFYETHDQLRAHLRDFVDAYNFARRLKTLRGLTPYEFLRKAWTSQPQRFTTNPLQKIPGLNTRKVAVFQRPCGTLSTRRSPFGAQPRRRVMLVFVQSLPPGLTRGSRQ